MSDCRSHQDELILRIYGEASFDSHHGDVCARCSDLERDLTEVLALYRSVREEVDPPDLVLPPRVSLISIGMAACLVILAAIGIAEATRVKPAYALTDRGIFWTLCGIHSGVDLAMDAGLGYEEGPFLEDLQDVGSVPDALWEVFPEDSLADAIDELNRRIHEVRRDMEVWI